MAHSRVPPRRGVRRLVGYRRLDKPSRRAKLWWRGGGDARRWTAQPRRSAPSRWSRHGERSRSNRLSNELEWLARRRSRGARAGEQHEREGRGAKKGGRETRFCSRPDLGPSRSRSIRNATRPLAMILNGLGRLFQMAKVAWPRSGRRARNRG